MTLPKDDKVIVGNPSLSDEDAEKLTDEDLISSDKPISNPVFKKRLNKVIGQRNILRDEKTDWGKEKEKFIADVKELEEYKELRDMANSDPRFAKAIMTAINNAFGDGAKTVRGKMPDKVQFDSRSEEDVRLTRIEQKQIDFEIEKHFDTIGVDAKEVPKLTEFCKKQGIDMTNPVLLEMAYKKVYPKTEKEPEDDKSKEPDSGTSSGIEYGDAKVKTVREAIEFAMKHHKAKKK